MMNLNWTKKRNAVICIVIVLLCIKILTPFLGRPIFIYNKDSLDGKLKKHFLTCSNVKETLIFNPNIYNLSCIKYCSNLEVLCVSVFPFTKNVDTKYLVNDNVKAVSFAFHSNDWSHLNECTNLEKISIINSDFSDTNDISDLSKLEELYIDTDNDLNIRIIEKSKKLKRITLISDKTIDVSGLSKLTNIEYLHIGGKIKNFNMIKSVSTLQLFGGNDIDFEHLLNINNLEKLVTDCDIPDEIIESLIKKGVEIVIE